MDTIVFYLLLFLTSNSYPLLDSCWSYLYLDSSLFHICHLDLIFSIPYNATLGFCFLAFTYKETTFMQKKKDKKQLIRSPYKSHCQEGPSLSHLTVKSKADIGRVKLAPGFSLLKIQN